MEAYIGKGTLLRDLSYKEAKQQAVESFSKEFLKKLLRRNRGNVSQSARQAGMDGANFRRLMRKYGIREPKHKQE